MPSTTIIIIFLMICFIFDWFLQFFFSFMFAGVRNNVFIWSLPLTEAVNWHTTAPIGVGVLYRRSMFLKKNCNIRTVSYEILYIYLLCVRNFSFKTHDCTSHGACDSIKPLNVVQRNVHWGQKYDVNIVNT